MRHFYTALLCFCCYLSSAQTWNPVGAPDSDQAALQSTYASRMRLDNRGNPVIAYSYGKYVPSTGRFGREYRSLAVRRYRNGHWEYLGNPGFTQAESRFPDMDLDGATPYVIYQDLAGGNRARVQRYDGSAWTELGASGLPKGAYNLAVRVAPDGTVYAAFSDSVSGFKLTVMKYDGTGWTTVGARGFTPGNADEIRLATGPSGRLYAAVALPVVNDSDALSVYSFDGTAWQTVGQARCGTLKNEYVYFANQERFDIQCSPSGVPHVLFSDYQAGNEASVLRFDGTQWAPLGSLRFHMKCGTLCFSPQDSLYVALSPGIATIQPDSNISVQRWTGTAWVRVGQASLDSTVYVTANLAYDTALHTLTLHTKRAGFSYVLRQDGGAWRQLGNNGIIPPDYSVNNSPDNIGYSNAAQDSSGDLYVAHGQLQPYQLRRLPQIQTLLLGRIRNGRYDSLGMPRKITTPLFGARAVATDDSNRVYFAYYDSVPIPGIGNYYYALRVRRLDAGGLTTIRTLVFPDSQIHSNLIMQIAPSGKIWLSTLYFGNFELLRLDDTGAAVFIRYHPTLITTSDRPSYDMALDRDGVPHVAIRSLYTQERAVVVRITAPNAFSYLGSASGVSSAQAYRLHLAFDNDNRAIFSCYDTGQNMAIAVRRFNGTTWDLLGQPNYFPTVRSVYPDPSVFDRLDYRLACGPNGTPYIFTPSFDSGQFLNLSVYKYANSIWSPVGSTNFAAGQNLPNRLFIQNNRLVAFYTGHAFDDNDGFFVRAYDCPTPATITAQPADPQVCAGSAALLSLSATGATAYLWTYNNGSGWRSAAGNALFSGAATASLTVNNTSAALNGYRFRCVLTNACDGSAVSRTATLFVDSANAPAPAVSIRQVSPVPNCAGALVRFEASAVNPGRNDSYLWQVDGSTVPGANGPSLAVPLTAPAQVACTLTRSNACTGPASAASALLPVAVSARVTPAVAVSVVPGTTLVSGQAATFTASGAGLGSAPRYLWTRNGVYQPGFSGPVVSTTVIQDNDVFACLAVSNADCRTADTAVSNSLVMHVQSGVAGVDAVALHCYPSPTGGTLHFSGSALSAAAQLSVHDLAGRAAAYHTVRRAAGALDIRLDASLASGVYIWKLVQESTVRTGSFVLQR